jgi:hypothetical protein
MYHQRLIRNSQPRRLSKLDSTRLRPPLPQAIYSSPASLPHTVSQLISSPHSPPRHPHPPRNLIIIPIRHKHPLPPPRIPLLPPLPRFPQPLPHLSPPLPLTIHRPYASSTGPVGQLGSKSSLLTNSLVLGYRGCSCSWPSGSRRRIINWC